jgi:hypothetical protein
MDNYFFERLENAIKKFMATPADEEAHAIAMQAIRRCKAIVAKDYKVLWEEVEGILLDVCGDLDRMQSDLDKERILVREIIGALSSTSR